MQKNFPGTIAINARQHGSDALKNDFLIRLQSQIISAFNLRYIIENPHGGKGEKQRQSDNRRSVAFPREYGH